MFIVRAGSLALKVHGLPTLLARELIQFGLSFSWAALDEATFCFCFSMLLHEWAKSVRPSM